MQIIETIGNRGLMDREKTLFICSKKTPIVLYEYVFKWVDSLTANDCIACFNSTEMEAEVLKALLVAKVPTVLFVMNRFSDVNNQQVENALREKRMLIVVLKRDEPREQGTTPMLRNIFVLSMCQHVVCGYVNEYGSVYPLVARRKDAIRLIDERTISVAAEPALGHERWSVRQDKTLLRMFYADMGIHAIHKQLQRSYSAVYARLRSITQPEEVLKGREFEDFVLSLFHLQEGGELVLQEWQGDKTYGMLSPENNSHPDLVFRYKEMEFAVECKWREQLPRDLSKDLFPPNKVEDYNNFANERDMPVTVILGIGGEPCNPEQLYKIPVERLSAIASGMQSLAGYHIPMQSLDASMFLPHRESARGKSFSFVETRRQYPNAYKAWSNEDDALLVSLYRQRKSMAELASFFKRKESAIRSRIWKLTDQYDGNRQKVLP